MSIVTRLLFVLAIALSNQVVCAQEKTETPKRAPDSSKPVIDPAKRADIVKMLKITGADKLGMQGVKQMIAMQRQSNPNVPGEFWDNFLAEVKPEELLELSVPSYAKHFTHDDIKQLIKFHESPIGRKLSAVQPLIMQESMTAGQKWGMDIGRRIGERLQSEGYSP